MVRQVEISRNGRWTAVPSLKIEDNDIVVLGTWLKIARIRSEAWLEKDLRNPDLYVRTLREFATRGFRADILTFSQQLPAMVPKYSYPVDWDSIAGIHLISFREWWEKLPQEFRKNVRRSQKRGIVVSVRQFDDSLVQQIMTINNAVRFRQGRQNRDYGKSFEQVKKDHGSFADRSDFICAHFGEELVGFLKLVYRGEVASIMQLTVNPGHNDKRPANALLAQAIELCASKRMNFVTYGYFNYGNKRDSSLREFKERSGFTEFSTPRYYVPLTPWGAFCTWMGLHRGALGILPPSLISGLLKLRSWFSRLANLSRCSLIIERPNCNR